MTFQELTVKVKVRRISRAFYLLIPKQLASELEIQAGDELVVMYDKKQRIIAYRKGER